MGWDHLSIYLGLLLVPFTLYYGFGCRRVSILGWGAVLNTMTDGIIYIIYLSIYLSGLASRPMYFILRLWLPASQQF